MALLENPAESPRFGCGPRHPRGLHLSFERRVALDGADEIVCEYVAKEDEIGWPGLLHIGLLFLVMMETSYWAALTLGGKVMTVRGPVDFVQTRLPRVGRKFLSRARLDGTAEEGLRITCIAEDENGRAHGTMASYWRPASRAAVERAGISLPAYLLEDMDP